MTSAAKAANERPKRLEGDELLVAAFMRFWPTVRADLGEDEVGGACALLELYDEGLWGDGQFSVSEILEYWPAVADHLRGRRWSEGASAGGLYIELEHQMLTHRVVEPRAEVRRWYVGLDDEFVDFDLRVWNDLRANRYMTPVERTR